MTTEAEVFQIKFYEVNYLSVILFITVDILISFK